MNSKELLEKAKQAYYNRQNKGYEKRSFIAGYLIGYAEQLHQPLVGRSEQLKALLSKVVNEFDSGEVTWDTRDEIESILKSL